jgi:hypothetical protein
MLSTDITSTPKLISIALAAGNKAGQRYARLASRMRRHDNEESAAEFDVLFADEQAYQDKISEWAALEDIQIDVDAIPGEWDDPNVETDYDVQARNPFRCTAYKALAYAVHNTERAFLFYTYVSADSSDADVCHHARVLAREELSRAEALRHRRRKAWHAQTEQITTSRIDPRVINSVPDLLVVTICIEQYLGRLFKLAESKFTELKGLAGSTRQSLSVSEKALREGKPPGAGVMEALKKVGTWRDAMLSETRDASAALRRLSTDCDRSFAFYNSVVKTAEDEAVMLMAQQQSVLATQRITELLSVTQKII